MEQEGGETKGFGGLVQHQGTEDQDAEGRVFHYDLVMSLTVARGAESKAVRQAMHGDAQDCDLHAVLQWLIPLQLVRASAGTVIVALGCGQEGFGDLGVFAIAGRE